MIQSTETLKVMAHGDRKIVITREFDAPRNLVFDAFTKPELLRQWLLGPPGWSMPVCDVDLRVGGKYRYVWRDSNGNQMGMGGVYREIVRPERIVATEKFDIAMYPGEAVSTVLLLEEAAKTKLRQTVLYESREARDAILQSPMESGLAASYHKLEQLLSAFDKEGTSL